MKVIFPLFLLIFLFSSCSYSSSRGWSFSNSESFEEEKARRRAMDRKTDRILEVGRTKDRAEARRQAKGEVFEEEFFRSFRP
jgi:hypothetical protein